MGCGDSKNAPDTGDIQGGIKRGQSVDPKMHLYGDYFNSDSRAIYAMLKYADVEFEWTHVDTLKGENFKEPYADICPTGHIPVLSKSGQLVHSQGNLLFEWVMKKEPTVGEALDPQAQEVQLRAMHRYFFKDLRNVTSQLIRRTALKFFDEAQA